MHKSEWTGLECVRSDCDGIGHVTVASEYGTETHLDAEEEVG